MIRFLTYIGRFDPRGIELMIAVLAICRGWAWLSYPDPFSGETYAYLAKWASADVWGCVLVGAGLLCLAGLYINGLWRPSPWLRIVASLFAGFVFAALALSFWYVTTGIEGTQATMQQGITAFFAFYCAVQALKMMGAQHAAN